MVEPRGQRRKDDDGCRRIFKLATRRFLNDLSADECRQLDDLVSTDPSACQWYVEAMVEIAAFHYYSAADALADDEQKLDRDLSRVKQPAQRPVGPLAALGIRSPILGFLGSSISSGWAKGGPFSPLLLLAVLLALVSWATVVIWISPRGREHATDLAAAAREPAPIARLTKSVDCRWSGERHPQVAETLAAGEWRLVSGTAELTFSNGVVVLVEGPTRLDLQSPQRTYLHAGKISARVPPQAIGYTVATPTATITDLGTEFGVDTSESGVTDVHVFSGKVSLESAAQVSSTAEAATRILLSANQSKRVEINGAQQALTIQDVPSIASPFVHTSPDGARRSKDHFPSDLIGYWNFDEQGPMVWDQSGRSQGELLGASRVNGLVGSGAARV